MSRRRFPFPVTFSSRHGNGDRLRQATRIGPPCDLDDIQAFAAFLFQYAKRVANDIKPYPNACLNPTWIYYGVSLLEWDNVDLKRRIGIATHFCSCQSHWNFIDSSVVILSEIESLTVLRSARTTAMATRAPQKQQLCTLYTCVLHVGTFLCSPVQNNNV